MRECCINGCAKEAPKGGTHGKRCRHHGLEYQRNYKRKGYRIGNTFIEYGIRWHRNVTTKEVVPADVFMSGTF